MLATTTPREGLDAYLANVGKRPLLTRSSELRLARAARAGDLRARSKLAEHNLRLVVSVARRYRGVSSSVTLEDLVSEGNAGLLKAIDRYDPELGTRLSTYATWWIRQSITHALGEQARTIRIPRPTAERLRLLSRAESELSADLGRAPTEREIAQRLGLTGAHLARLRSCPEEPTSLDAPLPGGREDENAALLELLGCPDDTDAGVLRAGSLAALRRALEALPHRERDVITRRFGLDGAEPQTLRQIAGDLGLSNQGVSLIERRARRALARSRGAHLMAAHPALAS